jgi:hypothetical protein
MSTLLNLQTPCGGVWNDKRTVSNNSILLTYSHDQLRFPLFISQFICMELQECLCRSTFIIAQESIEAGLLKNHYDQPLGLSISGQSLNGGNIKC